MARHLHGLGGAERAQCHAGSVRAESLHRNDLSLVRPSRLGAESARVFAYEVCGLTRGSGEEGNKRRTRSPQNRWVVRLGQRSWHAEGS
jgi:hypothetical protein